jgi:hemolysin activation/secretion protein
MAFLSLLLGTPGTARAGEEAPPQAPERPEARRFDVLEYRIEGSTRLSALELEAVLGPFLGPGRELADVERARAALEKAYSDRGFQTVTVAIPRQTVRDGAVTLTVTEGKVGRLRVRGARWYSPFDIERGAPSVAEGSVPNFDEVVRDIVALNQLPDRRVTPQIRSGTVPGTIDVDLNVQDTLPLHGALELNDRYSAGTTPLRLNGAIRYENLFQAGHSLGFAFQLAPERLSDAMVFSLFYLARLPGAPGTTLTLNGVIQNSDVSTLSGSGVVGKGWFVGGRATFALPAGSGSFQTLGAGLDVKRFEENIATVAGTIQTPITYVPVTGQYAATWLGDGSQTQLTATALFNVRALGSSAEEFDAKRYNASGSFILFRGEASRTDEVGPGLQLFGKVHGQYAGRPTLSSEQYTVGGMESVRGYLEVSASGDYGVNGTLEVRSPSLSGWIGLPALEDWRFFVFGDGGWAGIWDALPEQQANFQLLGLGGGTRLKAFGHVAATVEVGVPFTTVGANERFQPRLHFQVGGEF